MQNKLNFLAHHTRVFQSWPSLLSQFHLPSFYSTYKRFWLPTRTFCRLSTLGYLPLHIKVSHYIPALLLRFWTQVYPSKPSLNAMLICEISLTAPNISLAKFCTNLEISHFMLLIIMWWNLFSVQRFWPQNPLCEKHIYSFLPLSLLSSFSLFSPPTCLPFQS